MQLTGPIDPDGQARRRSNLRVNFVGFSLPTPAETAIASVRWERRGLLRRLVRVGPLASS
jgi:hypothetical protein